MIFMTPCGSPDSQDLKVHLLGASLVVQWLRLHTPNAEKALDKIQHLFIIKSLSKLGIEDRVKIIAGIYQKI